MNSFETRLVESERLFESAYDAWERTWIDGPQEEVEHDQEEEEAHDESDDE